MTASETPAPGGPDRTGPDRFAFCILETISAENGTHIFSIEVNQDAPQ